MVDESEGRPPLVDGRGHVFFILDDAIVDDGILAEMSEAEIKVYVVLCRRANKAGACWPTQERLVRDTGLSEKSVRSGWQRLVKKGLIRSEPLPSDSRRKQVVLTRLRGEQNRSILPVGGVQTPVKFTGVRTLTGKIDRKYR